MQSTIPADLLDVKASLDHWRSTRQYTRQPMPPQLRHAIAKICRRHPYGLVRRILNIDPWRLSRTAAKKSSQLTSRKKGPATFFTLPADLLLPDHTSPAPSLSDCRLQLDRPDGARLTLTLPAGDLALTRQICADFLRGFNQ